MTDDSPIGIPSHPGVYDTIGSEYSRHRVPDARIAAQILHALGDARTVCNVGAGPGAYEPDDREVVAVEPSATMCRQRSTPAIRAVAEALPFPDDSFDVATAFLSLHHWQDPNAGLSELRRVSKKQVLLVFDMAQQTDMWLIRDYLPEVGVLDRRAPSLERVADALPGARCEVVPVPWDCTDGFLCAYWRRPRKYLDPTVRACISGIAQLKQEVVERAIGRLRRDLDSGAWHKRYADLVGRDNMDYGYRLVVAE